MRLVNTIKHQSQPTCTSCMYTCIAMAIGVDALEVTELAESTGYGRNDGRMQAFLLQHYNLAGFEASLPPVGYGFRPNLYMMEVLSKTSNSCTHCILVDLRHEDAAGILVFDPQVGNVETDKCYLSWDDIMDLGIISTTALDDFKDFNQGDHKL